LPTTRRSESAVTPLAAFESAVRLLDLPITGVASAVAEKMDGESYAIKNAEGCVTDPTAKLVYVGKEDSLILAWRIETDVGSNWLVSYIDAVSGDEVTGVTEYKNNASYEAL
jgi:extracellular elastinolytic metalloproteinase